MRPMHRQYRQQKSVERESHLLFFQNPESSDNREQVKPPEKEKQKDAPLNADKLEEGVNEGTKKRLDAATNESDRETKTLEQVNGDLRKIDPRPKVDTPTPVGNLLNVDKNSRQLDMIGVSGEFAEQYAVHKTATDRAYRVFKQRPDSQTKQVLDTAITAERSVIEAHQSEWKTGDDSLKERDFQNRLLQLEQAQNSTPEQVTGKREFQEREKNKIETQETEYEQKIRTALQNEDPRYPLPATLKTFAQNSLDRLHTLQKARSDSETWQAKQSPDVEETYRAAVGSSADLERTQLKTGYGIWQGTALESVFRDRYAQIANDDQFARESTLVKSDLTEEKQLGDWLDSQDKRGNRAPGSTQARLRKNDPQGRLLFSNLNDFDRQKFTREKGYGSLPSLTQAQFDKKYFNADLFRSSVNDKGEFVPTRQEPGPAQPEQLANTPEEAEEVDLFAGKKGGVNLPKAKIDTPQILARPTNRFFNRNQPQQAPQPADIKTDAEAELQAPTDDGRGWDEFDDVEKQQRAASVKNKYGVSVDMDTGAATVPDFNKHEGQKEMQKNRFDGYALNNQLEAQKKIDGAGWDTLSDKQKEELTTKLQIEHGVSINDAGKAEKADGRFSDAINRLSGHLSVIMKWFEKIGTALGKAFGIKNKPKNAPALTPQQKDLQELVGSIANDKLWHPAAQLKKAEAGYNYRIGKDGRAYKKKGDEVKVADPDGTWKDIAADMKITDPVRSKMVRATVANNGDVAYVDIGGLGEPGWKFTVDGTRFITKNGDVYKEFNTANNKWDIIGEFKHT